jgi:hypothetical protein
MGIAYDSNGNLYIADSENYEVRVINRITGDISVFAGTGNFGNSLSGLTSTTQATSESFGTLSGLAVDSSNNVYFADRTNEIIWKVNTSGVISVFAGNGSLGYAGDGLAATSATLDNPEGLAFDGSGNLYIADSNNNVVRAVGSNGKINTFAGNGTGHGQFPTCPANFSGANGTATTAELCLPQGVAADASGNIYISSYTYDQVYIVGTNGTINVFAGSGADVGELNCCYTGDGAQATSAQLWRPEGIYTNPAGDIYIVDQFGSRIREVNTAGFINTVYGDGSGDVTHAILGDPDTESVNASVGDADGIYFITMDPEGDLIAPSADANVVLSAGSTGQYNFGQQQIYQTVTTMSLNAVSSFYPPYITVSNPSGVTLNFTGTPVVTGPFAIDGGTCNFPGSLGPSDSCNVIVSFTPTADQAYTGSIVLDSNANSSPSTINLSGTGIGFCSYSASLTSSLSFTSPPNVTTAVQAATLTNTGVCPISTNTSSASLISGAAYFALVSNNCPATLNGGTTCTFNIDFTPSALTGYSGEMQLDIPSYGNIHTILTGTGITAPAVSFLPTTLPFPNTTAGTPATPLTTKLTNIGNATLTNITIGVSGANPGDFSVSSTTCTTTLVAGASCNISVGFTPLLGGTTYTANLSMNDNAAGAPQTVALSGTGNIAVTLIVDAEAVHITDTPLLSESTLVFDPEAIHFTDMPSLMASTLVFDSEAVHFSDTPSLNASTLVFDAETIHTSDNVSIAVSTIAQTINFPIPTSPVTYGVSPITLSATSTSGLSITFSVLSGPGTVSGSTLTITGVGTVVLAANQAGNTNYLAATQVTQTIVVTQASQTINFTAPASSVIYGVSPITLVATGGASGNAVTFSVVSGPATVNGSTLTVTGVGAVVVAANQAGNANYSTAAQVTQSIVVNVAGTVAAPTFSPVAGTYTAAQAVTISDSTSGSTIYYTTNGTTPTTSSTKYTAAIAVASTETLEAIVTATGYTTSAVASAAYTLVNPAPAISGVSPAFTNAGGAAFTLTVNGTGFIASSTAYWGVSALTTTYVSATQLTAQVPAADIATAGTNAVTVQTPAPGGGASNAWQFEVDTSSTGTTDAPTITSATETVTAGSPASYPVTVPSDVTSISVTCLNLPAGATCSYSSTTNAVTIATSPTTPKGTYQIIVVFTETVTSAAFLLPILLLPLGLMRRKLAAARGIGLTACLGLVLMASAALSIGCGGGSSPPPSTQQATSSVSVTLTIQ